MDRSGSIRCPRGQDLSGAADGEGSRTPDSPSSSLPHLPFGGGKTETPVMDAWEEKYPQVVNASGKLHGISDELILMSHLRLMISMDSGNMHLASLVNTPVVSVWGATHPYAGFMGWHQSPDNAVQLDMPCRPCSIYGNKPCMRGDFACMKNISPELIVER